MLFRSYFAIVVGLYGVGFWLPQIVQGMGYSVRNTSYIVAIPYAVTVVAMIVWGGHSDRTGELRAGELNPHLSRRLRQSGGRPDHAARDPC